MVARTNKPDEYPDDIFADTRMTFGEHIDELRTRMIRALVGLMIFMVIGFILDAIGEMVGNKNIGIGKPMLAVITQPVESQVRDFYFRRNAKAEDEKLRGMVAPDPEDIRQIRQKLAENDNRLSALTVEERRMLLGAPQEMPVVIPAEAFVPVFGPPKPDAPKEIVTKIQVYPAYFATLSNQGDALIEAKQYLTTLSAQEAFVVYFKVSIICGIVLASPWILYQFWAFVGAGLYPHEKKYVYVMFWPSVILFIGGVLVCQFLVLPGAVKALLRFNEFLGFDPDIRLNEWLGLALMLPLVFGLSFQTRW